MNRQRFNVLSYCAVLVAFVLASACGGGEDLGQPGPDSGRDQNDVSDTPDVVVPDTNNWTLDELTAYYADANDALIRSMCRCDQSTQQLFQIENPVECSSISAGVPWGEEVLSCVLAYEDGQLEAAYRELATLLGAASQAVAECWEGVHCESYDPNNLPCTFDSLGVRDDIVERTGPLSPAIGECRRAIQQ